MPEWTILAIVAVVIVAVVIMIVRLHVNPVIALAIGAAAIGLMSGLGALGTVETMATGFGDTMAEAGLLIAWGVLIGSLLNRMGAITRLVESLLKLFGPKGVPFAIGVSFATYLQTIFVDVMIVLAAPLARRIAPRLGKAGVGIMAATFAISLETGIALMVPGIGAEVIVMAFAVIVIGGMGSIGGAAVGAVLVGLSRATAINFWPEAELFVIYAVMAAVLLFRPQGLFGEPAQRRI